MKARLPQGMGGGAQNMNQMIRQAQKMQEEMAAVQEELNVKEYTATSGGGMIEVIVTGSKQVKSVKLKPEVVDPEDIEMLEDLVVAAVNEALRSAEEDSSKRMNAITNGIGGMPGLF
ncbi:MAG: YbaB/EbfC family nucleoid-associated protein [Angelakisella sp.]